MAYTEPRRIIIGAVATENVQFICRNDKYIVPLQRNVENISQRTGMYKLRECINYKNHLPMA